MVSLSVKPFLHCPPTVQLYLPGGTSQHSQLIDDTSLPLKSVFIQFTHKLLPTIFTECVHYIISEISNTEVTVCQNMISGTSVHCNTMPVIPFHWKNTISQVLADKPIVITRRWLNAKGTKTWFWALQIISATRWCLHFT